MDWNDSVLAAIDGQGYAMDRLKRGHADAQVAMGNLLTIQEAKITQAITHLGEVKASEEMCGLRPYAEIPLAAYFMWKEHFRQKDRAAGILNSSGAECWKDADFQDYYRRNNPGLHYVERKKGNSIIAPATRWTKVGRAAA